MHWPHILVPVTKKEGNNFNSKMVGVFRILLDSLRINKSSVFLDHFFLLLVLLVFSFLHSKSTPWTYNHTKLYIWMDGWMDGSRERERDLSTEDLADLIPLMRASVFRPILIIMAAGWRNWHNSGSGRREEQRREDADVDDEENERRWSQPFSSAAIPSILALDQSLPHRRTPLSDHCKLIQHTSNHMGFPHGLRENRDRSPFHVSGLCASLKTGRTRARNQVWLL